MGSVFSLPTALNRVNGHVSHTVEHVGDDGHDGHVAFANELSVWISKELDVSCVLLDWHDKVVLFVRHSMRVTTSSFFRSRHNCDEGNATCAIFEGWSIFNDHSTCFTIPLRSSLVVSYGAFSPRHYFYVSETPLGVGICTSYTTLLRLRLMAMYRAHNLMESNLGHALLTPAGVKQSSCPPFIIK